MTLTSVAKASAIYMLAAVLFSSGHIALNAFSTDATPSQGIRVSLMADAGQ